MARMTISLPDELKTRMDAVKDGTNWSGVAAACFEKTLGELADRKRTKNMSDVVARLRASKIRHDESEYREGFDAGQDWAKNHASYDALKRTAAYDSGLIGIGKIDAPWRASDWLAFNLLGLDHTEASDAELESAIEQVWDTNDEVKEEFMMGFVEGASHVWDEVADKL